MSSLKSMRECRANSAREQAKKYSVRGVADYLGISVNRYLRLENGGDITLEEAAKLAELYGCDLHIFLR